MRTSREIYADILKRGLLSIRGAQSLDDAREIGYHLHNLPGLLMNLEHAGLHDYYWRIERAEFIQNLGKEKTKIFDDLWSELEAARAVETKIQK
jgi:hypothetical protein